jgi:hypothetical protein
MAGGGWRGLQWSIFALETLGAGYHKRDIGRVALEHTGTLLFSGFDTRPTYGDVLHHAVQTG